MKAVTLGPEGTYSHRAAGSVADVVEFRESVTAIVEAVADGQYDRGVVPIENSIEGSVTESLDVLADNELAVIKEIVTPIRHALLAQDETFETVASHSQALAQCREYLSEQYPDVGLEAVASTARGVEIAREDATVAGIAHPDNSGNGLQVLAEDIQDRTSNATRFFVVAPVEDRTQAGGKSTFIVYPNDDYPGLLLDLLEPFADRDINLTRVESRPSGERLGDYVFHIDIAAGLYEDRTEQALADIDELAADGWIRRLGSYDTSHVV
ncbi:prephenate dehydratase [Natranaeroarchaeum sulfidigenes]|uniref:Prephenate dehydratase n=1 Tax=Natranaeroarchaeum sulfidigenes TaxID=2784880 RepID=A0A897MRD2_9EURY|nr:prephenate dehydratase [Natranaeroarchaeum sulfidigenes]QSG01539.1 Prephenate dehydratase [Natranaeroarchaeum sulfidigenes]